MELGCHTGYSYFVACQAVKRLGLPTSCYAVDTWRGDEHSGFYGEEVFNAVRIRNQNHYQAFSQLVRATFEEASHSFADQSVALLHIDGRHFYTDVITDFETWKPKLTNNAIVLFHDTNVRDRDFGAWKLFGELSQRYPSFEFLHGNGLGVVAVGSIPPPLAPFFGNSDETVTFLRAAYSTLGQAVTLRWQLGELGAELSRSNAAVTAAEATVRLLTVAAEDTDRTLADRQNALASAEANVSTLTDNVAALQSENASLQAQIVDLQAFDADLRAQNANLRAQNADLDAQLQKTNRLRRLDFKRHEIDEQRSRRALCQAEELQSNVVQLERNVSQLNEEVARRQVLIDEIFASTSWRVSVPVRWAGPRVAPLTRRARMVRSLSQKAGRVSHLVSLGWDELRHARVSSVT